jgi:hypothetical protein
MPTLILSPRYTEDSAALREAAVAAGWKTFRLESWRVPDNLDVDDSVLYGEPYFAKVVAAELSLALLGPPEDWLSKVPVKYRRREVATEALGHVRRLDRPMFVKPCNDKTCPAQVYQSGVSHPSADVLPDDTVVQVAEPIVWQDEWRAFVLDRQARTMAVCKRDGVPTRDEARGWLTERDEVGDITAVLDAMLSDVAVECPRAVVIDVGHIRDRGVAVGRQTKRGAPVSTGYGCAPHEVLRVVRHATVSRARLDPADERWVLNTRTRVPSSSRWPRRRDVDITANGSLAWIAGQDGCPGSESAHRRSPECHPTPARPPKGRRIASEPQ